jgi:hypothetical protein
MRAEVTITVEEIDGDDVNDKDMVVSSYTTAALVNLRMPDSEKVYSVVAEHLIAAINAATSVVR